MKTFIQVNAQYEVRTETHNGKKHIVVPVVMMVEGVHSGSHGPLFHPASELGKFPEAWNGTPVTIMHPQQDGHGVSANSPEIVDDEVVGRVYNTHMDLGKLKGEVWLDEAILMERNPEVLDYINNGRELDVSIGVFSDEENTPGEWQGEQYTAIARNHRPDHLALLPGEEGACSWADGCGIRNNQKKGGAMSKLHGPCDILQVNRTDYAELQQSIQTKLDTLDSGNEYHYLRALYDNEFIYEVRGRDGSSYYKRGYSMNEDGSVEFGEEKQSVRRDVEFVAVNADTSGNGVEVNELLNLKKEKISMSETKTPCCPDTVDALIANERTKFTGDNKEWLLTLSAEELVLLEPEEVKEPEKVEVPQLNADEAKAVLKESISTPEDFLNLLPEGMRDQMESGMKLHQEQRKQMITTIQANAKNVWKEADLGAMNTEMLEKVFKSVNVADYSALSTGEHTVNLNNDFEEEPMLPTGMGVKKSKN